MNDTEDTNLPELAALWVQVASVIVQTHGAGESPEKPVGDLNLIRHNLRQIIEIGICKEGVTDPRHIEPVTVLEDAQRLIFHVEQT